MKTASIYACPSTLPVKLEFRAQIRQPRCVKAPTRRPTRSSTVVAFSLQNADKNESVSLARRSMVAGTIGVLVGTPVTHNAAWAAAKSAPPAPEGVSLDRYNEDVQALAAQVRDVIVFGTEGGEASDEDVKAKAQSLAKPIKNYFLVYGLRDGRMVLDKKLYAATPEYQTMYEVLGALNKFKEDNPPAFVGAPTPRIPADLSKELLEKLSEIP